MAANTRMATAIQMLCVLAYKGPDGTTSEVLAKSLRTNPVVVRRLLKCLQHHDLVDLRPGKDGGVLLRHSPADITLDQIYQAVESETAVFALRPHPNLHCPVGSRMKRLLTPIFSATDGAVEATLRQTTLGSLIDAIS
jgi:DNA-binding IscR family transcriptional regulator